MLKHRHLLGIICWPGQGVGILAHAPSLPVKGGAASSICAPRLADSFALKEAVPNCGYTLRSGKVVLLPRSKSCSNQHGSPGKAARSVVSYSELDLNNQSLQLVTTHLRSGLEFQIAISQAAGGRKGRYVTYGRETLNCVHARYNQFQNRTLVILSRKLRMGVDCTRCEKWKKIEGRSWSKASTVPRIGIWGGMRHTLGWGPVPQA